MCETYYDSVSDLYRIKITLISFKNIKIRAIRFIFLISSNTLKKFPNKNKIEER